MAPVAAAAPAPKFATVLKSAIEPGIASPVYPDSADAVSEARSAQARFERVRARSAPFSWWSGSGPCDERVGRFCLRFGTDDDADEEDRPSWTPPPESERVAEAREELLSVLEGVARAYPGDAWVMGQWVAYLAEGARWEDALEAARTCRAEGWWCHGLEGVALHGLGQAVEAEAAFQRVLEALPEDERREWDDPGLLGESQLYRNLRGLEGEEEERMRQRLWTLARPLFLLEGNSLRTEHLSRWMLSRTREDARNGHAMRWGDDMTELLVRYGPVVAYERIRAPRHHIGPPPVVGRYDPRTRHLLPTADAVEEPATSTSGDWTTHRRQTRSRHAPPAAPRIRSLDAQVARFPRGDQMVVVAAWELTRPGAASAADSARAEEEGVPVDSIVAPFPPAELETALFALDPEDLEPVRFAASRVDGTGSVAMARIATRPHLLSLEALDADGQRGWRQRRGVGPVGADGTTEGISDLLLLRPDPDQADPAAGPDRVTDDEPPLDSLISRAHRSNRFARGLVEVVWEISGLGEGDRWVEVQLSAAREDQGLLRRAGQALRILSRPSPTTMRWEEEIPEGEGTLRIPHLRRVVMDLSGLEPGTYELTLQVTPLDGSPLTSSREIHLTEAEVPPSSR